MEYFLLSLDVPRNLSVLSLIVPRNISLLSLGVPRNLSLFSPHPKESFYACS